ncbi:MAG: gliding motility-associated ABC transporter substrate-binding protein GldG [Paludibacteraceae bacterium]|nr:gliding motility-associated ABC transporter substrate-binding protein GldG [Paludibacteraceae bacterium]
MLRNKWVVPLLVLLVLVLVNVLAQFFFFRLDLTDDGRYSLSDNTKQLLSSLTAKPRVTVYLDGDLNPGFLRLKKGTQELLEEMKVYAAEGLDYEFVNPAAASDADQRNQQFLALERKGLRGVSVFDKDEEGKAIRKVVFPWAQLVYRGDTVNVSLLEQDRSLSGNENLNNSIENLEFAFIDPLRIATQTKVEKIAFIEGHGEYPAPYVYDASRSLARYFQVDRGVLADDPHVLDAYRAIVIAGPQSAYSESDKFIIDQYIMRGGRVLWLIDGIRMAFDSLSTTGTSPAIPLDVNLSDQLFRYGVRILPVVLEDMQCIRVPVNVAEPGQPSKYEAMPFYYSPLLLASPESPVTKGINQVQATFASGLDINVSDNPQIAKSVLLVTSNASHAVQTPVRINMNDMYAMDSKTYFTQHYLPVAASLEGVFPSVFANRMVPDGVRTSGKPLQSSVRTRMVVVANSNIIRNDVTGDPAHPQFVEMGFDRYTNVLYGNRDFIVNAVLYLTDDEGWLNLRSREVPLRMLNKVEVLKGKRFWQVLNVLVPVLLLLLFAFLYGFWRRRRWASGSVVKN